MSIKEIQIKNLDDPDLHPYRTLRQSVEHHRKGVFVAEGEKIVRRLTESPLEIISVLITPEWLNEHRRGLESRAESIDVYVADKKLLETIVGFHLHQGIMAVGKIPGPRTIDVIASKVQQPFLFVAVDGLTNAENLGVLTRNCAAFGVQALLVGETSSSPYLRRAVRNSMGAVFRLPVVHCASLTRALQELQREFQTPVIAAHPGTNGKPLVETDLKGNCCIVFGSEGSGVSQEVLEVSDEQVAIQMQNGVDSLNVASASAAFLFEVQRQRHL